jgi:hypothetical protein
MEGESLNNYHKIRDFHGSRLGSIGSSDIPVLAGFGRQYGDTPYTLYLEKIGEKTRRPAGPRAEWGHKLEPLILSAWIARNHGEEQAKDYMAAVIRGRNCGPYKSLTEARMPGRKYVLAHADLLFDPEGAPLDHPFIVEAKSTGFFSAKRREGEAFLGYDPDDLTQQGIPDPVFLQVQWQMLAYDVPEAFVAVLIDTGDYREYGPIRADPRVQEKCLALAERLFRCIVERKPPKPESWSDVASMWPVPNEKTAMLGGEEEMKAREIVREYWQIGERMDRGEARRKELKNALGIYIGENSILQTPDGTKLASSWIQNNPREVDLKKLENDMPDIFANLVEGGIITQTNRRELRPAKLKGEL